MFCGLVINLDVNLTTSPSTESTPSRKVDRVGDKRDATVTAGYHDATCMIATGTEDAVATGVHI